MADVTSDYSAGSQLLNLNYYWDNYSGSGYNESTIQALAYSYDSTTLLKTGSQFAAGQLDSGHTESCGYDANLDYLTSTNYGDSYANPVESWAYDAAGNRSSDSTNPGTWTYDNLNRMSASPQGSFGNDVLGNRLSSPNSTLTWDPLNRLASFTSTGTGGYTTNYTYRSDGLRVLKTEPSTSTSFAYDGQMGFEDVDTGGSNAGVTDYAIGPRGIDRIAKGSSVSYPLYDGHGNMISTLSEASGGTCTFANTRAYDAWGNVRSSQESGDPKGRYCANLGHKQDDESGLVYMRARYCDPSCGRFISEDPSYDGHNWFAYCASNPLNLFDSTGCDATFWAAAVAGVICMICAAITLRVANPLDADTMALAAGELGGAVFCFGVSLGETKRFGNTVWNALIGGGAAFVTLFVGLLTNTTFAAKVGGPAGLAILALATYDALLIAAIIGCAYDGDTGEEDGGGGG